jgi:CRISPR-associated protein Cas5d
MEVSGPTAMWTRPDTGDVPVSYPAPTFSAAKGIFESVLWLQSTEIKPTRVEICAPLVYHPYTTQYGGPLRKSSQIRRGHRYQLIATVLTDVCYRLYAAVGPVADPGPGLSPAARRWAGRVSGARAYQEMFRRRLDRGQFHRAPSLGWQEFLPDYLGPFRAGTRVERALTLVLPCMLHAVFPHGRRSARAPCFRQNVRIEKGVLHYAP